MSASKSRIWYSPNTNRVLAMMLSMKVGMPCTTNLGMYLGIPLHHNRVRIRDYQYLLEKVRKKMDSWKWKQLLRGPKLLLIQTVTNTIALYAM